jgi:hypothetical protein
MIGNLNQRHKYNKSYLLEIRKLEMDQNNEIINMSDDKCNIEAGTKFKLKLQYT